MARYIDAVNAAEIISDKLGIALSELVDVMATVPTADVQEVKRGYWKFNQHSKVVASFTCSECQSGFYNFGNSKILSPTPYCPCCGARMEGDNNA